MKSLVRPFPQQARGRIGEAVRPAAAEGETPPTPGYVLTQALLFLRRNLVRIALVSTLATLAAFGAALLLFNKYSATATIVVDPRATKVTQGGGVLANTGLDNNAIESLALIAKSDGFLGALVDKLDLVNSPYFSALGPSGVPTRAATIEKLGASLNVSRRGATYVLEATAASTSADESAKVANTVAQMIVDDQRGLRSGANENTAVSIKSRLAEVKERVNRAEAASAELKGKLKVTGAGQGATLLERRVFELNQQLVLAAAKTGEARARYDQLRKAGPRVAEDPASNIQSTVLSALRIEYVRLTRQSAEQATVLGGRHPEVASLNAQLNDMRRQINAELARLMTAARSAFLEAEQREAALARQMKDVQKESGDLDGQLVKLGELEREAKAESVVYGELLTRQKELDETKTLDPSDIRIVSAAQPPVKTAPGKTALAAGASLLGLLAGLGFALASEAMRRTLKTTRQAERFTGAAVGGLVPAFGGPRAAASNGPPQFDAAPWLADLCSSLALERGRGGAVLLVTSARRGEGSKTIAAGMAASLAQAGEGVLLIEADRPPQTQRRPRFGLIDVLARDTDLQSAFIDQAADGYKVLPFGGRYPEKSMSAVALMRSAKLRSALRDCRSWFDFVIIDAPPVLDSSHAGILASQTDQTVLVVSWDETSQADVREALDHLGAGQMTLVLNKVDAPRYRLFDPGQSYRLGGQAEHRGRAA